MRRRRVDGRVTLADDDAEAVLEEVGALPCRPVVQDHADDDVELAALQQPVRGVFVHVIADELNVGSLVRQPLDQRRHEKDAAVLDKADAERAHQLARLELVLPRRGDQIEDLGHGHRQFERALGRLHAAAGSAEQRVAIVLPQASERMAHRRLAAAHLLGGFGDVPVLQERAEDHQQLDVDAGRMHGM